MTNVFEKHSALLAWTHKAVLFSFLFSQMESSLHKRIYQRVADEVNDDEQFCTYLAEICTDANSHCDDLRDIIDTMVKTSHPHVSETRRQRLTYALLDMIEEDRAQASKDDKEDSQDVDDIDLSEQLERDGECKLCGCSQRITSRQNRQFCFR